MKKLGSIFRANVRTNFWHFVVFPAKKKTLRGLNVGGKNNFAKLKTALIIIPIIGRLINYSGYTTFTHRCLKSMGSGTFVTGSGSAKLFFFYILQFYIWTQYWKSQFYPFFQLISHFELIKMSTD